MGVMRILFILPLAQVKGAVLYNIVLMTTRNAQNSFRP